MENSKQWYVIYTKAGHEKKVCDLFRRKKLDSFYPANKLTKTHIWKRADFLQAGVRALCVCSFG